MPRSLYQNTVMVKGPAGAIPLAGAAVSFREPSDGSPIAYPLYADGVSTTPLTLPYVTGVLGELEVWADLPHRVRIEVVKGGLTQAQETIDLEYPPEYSATTEDISNAIAAHEAKDDPHDQYLTQQEGDDRFLQLTGGTVTGNTWVDGGIFTARDIRSGPDNYPIWQSGDGDNALEWRDNGFYVPNLTTGLPTLDDRYEQLARKGMADGYVPLDGASKIPNAYLPDLAITNTFVVTSEVEMLALVAQTGDVCVRLDSTENYILAAEPATVLGNWTKLAASTSAGNTTIVKREEFAPAASSTSVALAAVPTQMLAVSRNGVEQSQPAGHYSVAGVTVTFTDAFVAGERVSVVYEVGSSAPAPINGYTKLESDARYEPIDTMYTKAESDAKYALLAHNHDASYATAAHSHTGTYVPLAGGSVLTGLLGPTTTNTLDLGTTALRWRKLWGVDATLSGTVNTGPLNVNGLFEAYVSANVYGALFTNGPLSVGWSAASWSTDYAAIQVGRTASLASVANAPGGSTYLGRNTYLSASNIARALEAGSSSRVQFGSSGLDIATAPSVAAGAAQTFTTRMTLDIAGNMGLGVTPPTSPAPNPVYAALHVGYSGSLRGYVNNDADVIYLASNTYLSGANEVAIRNAPAARVGVEGGEFIVRTYASVAAGATQTPVVRARIANTGTLTLTPDAAAGAISIRSPGVSASAGIPLSVWTDLSPQGFVIQRAAGENFRLGATPAPASLELYGGSQYVHPTGDNTQNLGHPSARWIQVCAVAGAINTSVYEAKQDFAPLDPVACAQAVQETDWVHFTYKPPAPAEALVFPGQDEQTPEEKSREAEARGGSYARMLQETAPARHQKGYVLQSPEHTTHALFGLEDRKSASPSSDLAVVACALQEVLRRLAIVEGKVV